MSLILSNIISHKSLKYLSIFDAERLLPGGEEMMNRREEISAFDLVLHVSEVPLGAESEGAETPTSLGMGPGQRHQSETRDLEDGMS